MLRSPVFARRSSDAQIRRIAWRDAALASVIALATFLLAFDGGGYGETTRGSVAIVAWWAVILVIAFGVWPLERPPRAAISTGVILLALGLWTFASVWWADSAEKAFAEVNRVGLYLGAFTFVVLAARRTTVGRWSDGMAAGITGVGLVALTSRLFPGLVSTEELETLLPVAYTRLSFPIGYWNGLAILVALALPLLLRAAILGRAVTRGVALAAIPALASVIYLTSSRGAVATALVGVLSFVLLARPRLLATTAAVTAGLGSAAAVWVLLDRHELVNDPLDAAAKTQGRSAVVLLAAICILTGLAHVAASQLLAQRVGRSRRLEQALVVATVAFALVAIVAVDPVERFRAFKEPPRALLAADRDYVRAHLLSGNGSGRWQHWQAAVDEFRSAPAIGRGAGSYEAWWAQHGSLATFVRDAHSLYVEVLGELGLVGFLILASLLGVAAVVIADRTRRTDGEDRITVASLAAVLLAFAVAAGVDWMWELTVVSVVGIVCLALLMGPATALSPRPRLATEGERPARSRSRFTAGVGVLLLAWALICAQAIPLLASTKIRDSQAAVLRRDSRAALADALAARNLQPWAASPYLQLALVEEESGRLGTARTWIRESIERDPKDWRLWLVAARVETKLGAIRAATKSLARAKALNPRSTLFAPR